MPAAIHHPEIRHRILDCTFTGIHHPISSSDAQIHQFRGIKYASIPARFRQSKLFASYPLRTDATKFGPICPQVQYNKTVEEEMYGLPTESTLRQSLKQNEFDCLNLNITVPASSTPQSKLPVMVWVHGGSDRGSGSSWVYDGGNLVKKSMLMGKPIIVVTFNFRLGLFGFAANAMIREDNKAVGEEGVGNYGLRDQRRAFEWIHHFISEFGGDSGNVTVFGESTGAADIVSHLLSAPHEHRPLFHRGIISSALVDLTLPDVPTAGWHLSRIMSMLHVSTLEQLRAVDADKLTALGSGLRAVDDGTWFCKGWKERIEPEDKHRLHHRVLDSRSPARSQLHLTVPVPNASLRSHSHSRSRKPLLTVHSSTRSRSQSRVRRSSSKAPSPRPVYLPPNLPPILIGDSSTTTTPRLFAYPASMWTAPALLRRIKAITASLAKSHHMLDAFDISSWTPDHELAERIEELISDARVGWPTECVAAGARRERGGRGVWRYVFDQEGGQCVGGEGGWVFGNANMECSRQDVQSEQTFCKRFECDFDNDEEMEDFKVQLGSTIRYGGSDSSGSGSGSGDLVIEDFDDDMDMENWGDVDTWGHTRVQNTLQERWIAFAHGEAPWTEERVFVFGPEGEVGERSASIFKGRRRKEMWREVFEPLGMALVGKIGMELSRGPPLGGEKVRY